MIVQQGIIARLMGSTAAGAVETRDYRTYVVLGIPRSGIVITGARTYAVLNILPNGFNTTRYDTYAIVYP